MARLLSFLLLCAMLVLTGCQRSPAEQLAYRHAEEQYRINTELSERYRHGEAVREANRKTNQQDLDEEADSASDDDARSPDRIEKETRRN